MGTYFGSYTPAHCFVTKVRWLVGALVSICGLLLFAIIYLVQSDSPSVAVEMIPQESTEIPEGRMLEVIVAKQRIEPGEKLRASLFEPRIMRRDATPIGAIAKQDITLIVGKYARRLIAPRYAITLDDISNEKPHESITIPPNFRLATIIADPRQLAGGHATPHNRVDVLWIVHGRKGTQLYPLVRYAKIVSVNGHVEPSEWMNVGGKVPVSLLVPTEDARRIELARTQGSLTLSLLGKNEGIDTDNQISPINFNALLGEKFHEEQAEIAVDGTLIVTDNAGRPVKYVLANNRWKRSL